jgi:hypothetical protein
MVLVALVAERANHQRETARRAQRERRERRHGQPLRYHHQPTPIEQIRVNIKGKQMPGSDLLALASDTNPMLSRGPVLAKEAYQSASSTTFDSGAPLISFEYTSRGQRPWDILFLVVLFDATWAVELMLLDQFEEGEPCFFGVSAYFLHRKDEVSL